MNAANEIAVDAFLNRRIAFLDIPRVIEETLAEIPLREVQVLDDVLEADAEARRIANGKIS